MFQKGLIFRMTLQAESGLDLTHVKPERDMQKKNL